MYLIRNISWMKATYRRCTIEQFNKKVEYLKKHNFWYNPELANQKYCRLGKNEQSYCTYTDPETGKYFLRYVINCELFIYGNIPGRADDTGNDKLSGNDAYNSFNNDFRTITKKSLTAALSGTKYKQLYTAIRNCVPSPINYGMISKSIIKNCYKADISSAFPSMAVNNHLPTLKDAKLVKGKAEPTAEYPFAFYTKSGHIKTLFGLDTTKHKYQLFSQYTTTYNDDITEEETVLCKEMPAKYKAALDKVNNNLYQQRKNDPDNKFIMNATYGYFYRTKNPILSFISAIVIASCNDFIIKTCRKLERQGNIPVLIAVDSIAWHGQLSNVAVDIKHLGSFTYEHKNVDMAIYGAKKYAINSNPVVIKWAGNTKVDYSHWNFDDFVNLAAEEESRFGTKLNLNEHTIEVL